MKRLFLLCMASFMLFAACGQSTGSPPPPTPASSNGTAPLPHQSSSSSSVSSSALSLPQSGEVTILDEPFLDAQYRDILTNPEDYAGKVFQLEGMYNGWENEYAGGWRHAVVRYCPDGCCGAGLTGLEIFYEGERPEENDWVRVTGTIEVLPLGNYPLPFPLLKVTSMEIRNHDRGNEYVAN